MTARVLGVRANYQTILRIQIVRGRFLAQPDDWNRAHVCAVGAGLARVLFGYEDPIGQSIRVGPDYYSVVGIVADQGGAGQALGTLSGRDLGRAVIVPISSLLGRDLDIVPSERVDEIWLQARDGERVEEVGAVMKHSLVRLHNGVPDVDIVVPRELLAQRYRTQRTFSVVVGSVAALALLVGGIGIMNIMLTSVIERTTEIGVRRTVGATRRDVTAQFLAESLLMTLGGGAVGIVLGIGVSWGITAYAGWTTRVSPLAVGLAFAVSFLVGLFFGLYPAMKAASLEPVDALRYE
jgi:putative ABC transport system permease protein